MRDNIQCTICDVEEINTVGFECLYSGHGVEVVAVVSESINRVN